uniref:RING-type domain-containing protein n=1 Tax=Caenorhabditis tropicalis TaxID=1561998 RepID=A0A1I7TA90_9PELO
MGNCLPTLFGFVRQQDETPLRRNRSSEGAMSFTNPNMLQQGSSYVNQLYQHNVIRQRQAEERGKEIDEAKKNRIRGLLDQIPADVFRGDMASNECAICMIDFEPGERIRFLPCMHSFHQECVDEWLMKSFTCPSCLEPVDSTILSSLTAHNMQSLQQITSSVPSSSAK